MQWKKIQTELFLVLNNRTDQLLSNKYNNDDKTCDYIHEINIPIDEIDLFNTFKDLKNNTDNKIISNSNILENEALLKQCYQEWFMTLLKKITM